MKQVIGSVFGDEHVHYRPKRRRGSALLIALGVSFFMGFVAGFVVNFILSAGMYHP